MVEFKKYRKKGYALLRPYIIGENMTGISVSGADQPPVEGGMIAKNKDNPNDKWYISPEAFKQMYESEPFK